MKTDLTNVVKAAYQVEQSEDAWSKGILGAVRSAIDGGLGVGECQGLGPPGGSSSFRLSIASTVAVSRSQRDSVGCDIPTSAASAVAVSALGPSIRRTIRALNVSVYSISSSSFLALFWLSDPGYDSRRSGRQLPWHRGGLRGCQDDRCAHHQAPPGGSRLSARPGGESDGLPRGVLFAGLPGSVAGGGGVTGCRRWTRTDWRRGRRASPEAFCSTSRCSRPLATIE